MKKVAIVNCFDTYEDRIDLIYDFFRKKNCSVTVIQSNFMHIKKTKRNEQKQNFIFIETKPYYKNLSFDRLISHYNFAKMAFKVVNEINPDLLYVVIPPNSLAYFAAQYKKKNKNVKLIFDLIDLWPETMPVGNIKHYYPFKYWGAIRDWNLKYADIVITECDLYQTVLKGKLDSNKTRTVLLAKKDVKTTRRPVLDNNEFHLCYLGSINNIIDIDKVNSIIKVMNQMRPTTLHIIGDGERRNIFIQSIEALGCKVEYYGKIYDSQRKQDIFDRCHLGLNIMKDSVCVGLTMKSIDYFQYGLPIINNIQSDTSMIVEKHNIGFNITNENIEEVVARIANMDIEDFVLMRNRTNTVFNQLFSKEAFAKRMEKVISI